MRQQSFLETVAAAPPTVATGTALMGTPRAERGGVGGFDLARQDPLYCGDAVSTGPRDKATLLYSNGAQVVINVLSELRIRPPSDSRGRQNLFFLSLGILRAKLQPGQRVQTQYANVAVRGTEILLAVGADGTKVLTTQECAAAFPYPEGATASVGAAQQSVVRPGQASTPP